MKEELEKAAKDFQKRKFPFLGWDGIAAEFRSAFQAGAEWQSKQSPWRIVADEPPPEWEDVLLSSGSRPDIFVGYFNGEDFTCRSTGGKIEYFRVLHWMQIPE